MTAAIRQTVTVGPGGRIEVRSPDLTEGSRAEVIVLVETSAQATAQSQLEALKKLQDSLKLTPEAAQNWIAEARAERQAWGNRG
jgi:hypothetical protein